jgi:hypothetical protein
MMILVTASIILLCIILSPPAHITNKELLSRVTSSRSGVTFLAPLANAAQGKHGNVRILARSYGTAKTQMSSSVQLTFLSMLMCCCRHFLLNMPSFLQYVFSMAAAITAGSQKMDSQAKKSCRVCFS